MTLDWPRVVARVPRERFIPDVIWRHDPGRLGNDLIPVDRRTDPDTWTAIVAGDGPVLTQVDNGHPAEDGTGFEATSSCSDRQVVREMLELLSPEPGERVLEIGTGTGWNAALLASLGVSVTSVEIDESIARRAQEILRPWGDIRVLHGDGATPLVCGADRVISTVGTRSIPWSWIEQTRLGGRIVAPLTGAWFPPGLVVLERTEQSAHGRLAGPADFMRMRAQARSRAVLRTAELLPTQVGTTTMHPYYLTGDSAAAIAIERRTSDIRFTWRSPNDSADGVLWLYGPESWATIDATTAPPYEVEQAGPRLLVDEVLAAHKWWREQGEPRVEHWRVVVDQAGQRITLDR